VLVSEARRLGHQAAMGQLRQPGCPHGGPAGARRHPGHGTPVARGEVAATACASNFCHPDASLMIDAMMRNTMARATSLLALGLLSFAAVASSATGHADQEPDGVVDQLVGSMSPRERIGQLAMVEFPGDAVPPELAELIRDYKVGAVLLSRSNCNIVNGPQHDPLDCGFSRQENPDTPAQVAFLVSQLQQEACDATRYSLNGQEYCLPLFVAVDHEGDDRPMGRLLNRFTPIPSAMAIGATFDPGQAESVGCIVGRELDAVGVNMLLGPVLDVLEEPRPGGEGDLGTRVLGGDPAWVGEMGRAYIRGVHACSEGRVATVAKHFPGHGRSKRRLEDEVSLVTKSLSQLQAVDLVPFAKVGGGDISHGERTDAMMTSHLAYSQVEGCDGSAPITLSPVCAQSFLGLPEFAEWRRTGGLVVADALWVGAVSRYSYRTVGAFAPGEIAYQALMAGNDVLPFVPASAAGGSWAENAIPTMKTTLDYLLTRYEADENVRARVDDAVRRVVALKSRLRPGLNPAEVTAAVADPGAEMGQSASLQQVNELAEKALTLIRPASWDELGRSVPPPSLDDKILFVECWDDPYCSPPKPEDTTKYPPVWPGGKLKELALQMFPGRLSPGNVDTLSFSDMAAVLSGAESGDKRRLVEEADWIVLALLDLDPESFPASKAAKDFLRQGPAMFRLDEKKVVVVAYASPYYLDEGELNNVDVFIAMYSKVEPFLRTSLKAIFQDPSLLVSASEAGSLPVDCLAAGYDLSERLQPDASQNVELRFDPADPAAGQELTVSVAAPLTDGNGRVVMDGTEVRFTFASATALAEALTVLTAGGAASATYTPVGAGALKVTAVSGGWSAQDTVKIEPPDHGSGESPLPQPGLAPAVGGSNGGGGAPPGVLIGSVAGAIAAGGITFIVLYRRRRVRLAPPPAQGPSCLSEPSVAAGEATRAPLAAGRGEVVIDLEGRRVYLSGKELLPSFSRDQYELLAHLFQNAGRACTRDEIIRHVWPDAEAAGVSEEALDALVHRVRQRLCQGGATRTLIITLRGQGFRLEP